MKQIQILNQHKNNVSTINFMNKSNQLISGDNGGSIVIWSRYNSNQWNSSQIIKGHSNYIHCLILNINEDLFISSSGDKTIKFWIIQNEWICQQTITDHTSYVCQLSLNEQQDKLISCGGDKTILVFEYSEQNKRWIVIQNIKVDQHGYRLCFINNDQFTFQPYNGNLMDVYESKQFTITKHITINQGPDSWHLFPQQFFNQKQILVNKHEKCINLIRKTENNEFKLEQSIQFNNNCLFGQLSDDGQYLYAYILLLNITEVRKEFYLIIYQKFSSNNR
ncbi:unnamed protein product [Paramecium octaurelia]|uniref:Uncharacterized protein n=1 Tax=Paramecium octaurelia TaxID=43137 RepID=A0A8S1YI94_PAROT|nr:unnamed protein product [Paramecium octaurelia]